MSSSSGRYQLLGKHLCAPSSVWFALRFDTAPRVCVLWLLRPVSQGRSPSGRSRNYGSIPAVQPRTDAISHFPRSGPPGVFGLTPVGFWGFLCCPYFSPFLPSLTSMRCFSSCCHFSICSVFHYFHDCRDNNLSKGQGPSELLPLMSAGGRWALILFCLFLKAAGHRCLCPRSPFCRFSHTSCISVAFHFFSSPGRSFRSGLPAVCGDLRGSL